MLKWRETLEALEFLVSGLSHQWRSEAPGFSTNGNIGWRLAAGHCQWIELIQAEGWNWTFFIQQGIFYLVQRGIWPHWAEQTDDRRADFKQSSKFFPTFHLKSISGNFIIFSSHPNLPQHWLQSVCPSAPLHTSLSSLWREASLPHDSGPFHDSRFGQWTLSPILG